MTTPICPRCQQQISFQRLSVVPVVCDHCAYISSAQEAGFQVRLEREIIAGLMLVSAALAVTLVHVANWGQHSLTALPSLARQWTGLSTPISDEKLASFALELKKYDLVEDLYTKLATASVGNHKRLARFQMSRKKYAIAAATFRTHIGISPDDMEARFHMARCLGETGQIDAAALHYDKVLRSKPGVVQVTVIQNYIKQLLANERYAKARDVIEEIRGRDHSVTQYLQVELKLISEKLDSSS